MVYCRWIGTVLILALFMTVFVPVDGFAAADAEKQSWEEMIPSFIQCSAEQKDKFLRRLPEYEQTENVIGFENNDGTATVFLFASPIREKNENGVMQLLDAPAEAMAADTFNQKLEFSQEAAVYGGIPNYAFGDTGSVRLARIDPRHALKGKISA